MNRPPTITPYKDKVELLKVRELFYQKLGNHAALRNAVDTVTRWQTRGKLPHAVNATVWIISAMLMDNTNTQKNIDGISNSEEFLLRNAYSMALVRFVNGILDPFQQGSFATALLCLAKDIGLPYSFVEIRHWATHEQLPSLELLQATSKNALNWLYEKFWLPLDLLPEAKNLGGNSTHTRFAKLEVVSSLRAYRSFVKRQTSRPKPKEKAGLQDFHEIQKLKSISEDGVQSYHLIRLLSLKKALLKDVIFSTAQTAYAPLLENLGSSFLLRLVFALLLESQTALPTVSLTLEKNLVAKWLEFLVPRILQGPFPFELHRHVYSCEQDVIHSLENYICLLDNRSEYSNIIGILNRSGSEKRKFTKVPLLDEVLSSPTSTLLQGKTSIGDESEEFQIPKRRRKACLIFEDIVSWEPAPFGVKRTA